MSIAQCDNCGKTRPGSKGSFAGMETWQCYVCQGDVEDPYGELPEDPVGHAIYSAFSAIDDLIVLANQEATKKEVCNERVQIGQILNRCQLLASFVRETPALKVISNG